MVLGKVIVKRARVNLFSKKVGQSAPPCASYFGDGEQKIHLSKRRLSGEEKSFEVFILQLLTPGNVS